MKILERIIKLYEEDDDNEWVTTRSGHHVLIDPDGEIQSGKLKGTNIDDFKKNAAKAYGNSTKSSDIDRQKEAAYNRVKNDSYCSDKSLEYSFERHKTRRNVDDIPVVLRKSSSDLTKNSEFRKNMDKGFRALASCMDGDELAKFKKEYKEANSVFDNDEAKEVVDMMKEYTYNNTKRKGPRSIEDELERNQEKLNDLISYSKKHPEQHDNDNSINELKKGIEELKNKKKKIDKWQSKVENAQFTYHKVYKKYETYKRELEDFEKNGTPNW